MSELSWPQSLIRNGCAWKLGTHGAHFITFDYALCRMFRKYSHMGSDFLFRVNGTYRVLKRFSPMHMKNWRKIVRFQKGDKVKWAWGNGHGSGTVQSVFHEKTTRKIKGTEVTRNGSKDDPAVYIKQDDGDAVLKLASEIEKK